MICFLRYFTVQMQVHYTARFSDGIVFDSSYKRARPLTMRIGVGKVLIKCFVQFLKVHMGLKSMANLFKSEGLQALRRVILFKRKVMKIYVFEVIGNLVNFCTFQIMPFL